MKRYRQPYRTEESSVPGIMPWAIHRVTGSGGETVDGGVVIEEPLEIRVNGRPVAVLMRTPGLEKELAAGFCLGEGIVADLAHVALVQHCGRAMPDLAVEGDELDQSRNRVDVRLMPGVEPAAPPEAVSLIRSGCGRSDAATMLEELAPVNGQLRVPPQVLSQLAGEMRLQQEAYRLAGGIHAAAVFDARGRAVVVCEDIGRHNAVDKAIGYCLLRGIPLQDKIVMSTGRASYEMVTKGVRLGVPILATLSSPTSLAVELAEALNCTLIGYLRGKALNVYTHGWRIEGEGASRRADKGRGQVGNHTYLLEGEEKKVSVEEILKEAIQGEVESYELYQRAADMVGTEHIKELLRELAQEELGHKAALEKMLISPAGIRASVKKLQAANIQDYKIADHLVAQPLGLDATFQDVCIFAAKKEQQSYELYRGLAEQNEGTTRDLLEAMAKDELRHKNLVEGWYEEVVYQEF